MPVIPEESFLRAKQTPTAGSKPASGKGTEGVAALSGTLCSPVTVVPLTSRPGTPHPVSRRRPGCLLPPRPPHTLPGLSLSEYQFASPFFGKEKDPQYQHSLFGDGLKTGSAFPVVYRGNRGAERNNPFTLFRRGGGARKVSLPPGAARSLSSRPEGSAGAQGRGLQRCREARPPELASIPRCGEIRRKWNLKRVLAPFPLHSGPLLLKTAGGG